MLSKIVARSLIALALLAPSTAAHAEEPIKAIDMIGYALHTYDHSSTVQFKATVIYTKVPGEVHTMRIDAKVENSPNDYKTLRSNIVMRESVVKDGVQLPSFEIRTVDDGVATYVINPQEKTYRKSKHVREFCSNFFERSISRLLDNGYEFFVSRAVSQGKLVSVLASKKPIQGLRARIIIGVDGDRIVLRRISTLGEKGDTVVSDFVVTDHVFGEPLPPAVFAKPPTDFAPAADPVQPGPVVTGIQEPSRSLRKVGR